MKKRGLIITTLLVIAIAGFCYWYYTMNSSRNKIYVAAEDGLSAGKIRIELGFYSGSSRSDKGLVQNGLDDVVYSNGIPRNNFETICGENDFFITYDNEYYTIIRHFIPNDFHDGVPEPHEYFFTFKKQNGQILVTVDIKGEDGEQKERLLQPVSAAGDNVWGTPKDKTD